MQKFEFLRQPLLGELAMSRKKERKREEREKNAIYSGHLRLCQQPRAAHALRLDQCIKNDLRTFLKEEEKNHRLVFQLFPPSSTNLKKPLRELGP